MPRLLTSATIASWPAFTHRTLGTLFRHLGRPDLAEPEGRDHHESDWYVQQFGVPKPT